MWCCTTKKDILYLQNAEDFNNSEIFNVDTRLQPNDVLQVNISAVGEEIAIQPYNMSSQNGQAANSPQLLALSGYLITDDHTIELPTLGQISTKDESVESLQEKIKKKLVEGGHLKNPIVQVRLVNSKFTILGAINSPGTYNFIEKNITIFQALGYAGDLSIQGKRDDILVIRESDSLRSISHLDLTSGDIFESPYYLIKPNDVIYVNPNGPRIKSAGYITNVGSLLSVFSIVLSTILIITNTR